MRRTVNVRRGDDARVSEISEFATTPVYLCLSLLSRYVTDAVSNSDVSESSSCARDPASESASSEAQEYAPVVSTPVQSPVPPVGEELVPDSNIFSADDVTNVLKRLQTQERDVVVKTTGFPGRFRMETKPLEVVGRCPRYRLIPALTIGDINDTRNTRVVNKRLSWGVSFLTEWHLLNNG